MPSTRYFFFIYLLLLLVCSAARSQTNVTVSGLVRDGKSKTILPFVNISQKTVKDSTLVTGTITTLNKNEFADRYYDDGVVVKQQTKRNRNTNFLTLKSGVDWFVDANNTITVSGMFSTEKIIDRGDEPFFDDKLVERWKISTQLPGKRYFPAISNSMAFSTCRHNGKHS